MKTKQRIIIFNRGALQSAGGWIHIVPKGELPNKEAGVVQVLDDASLDSILDGIEKDKNRLGDKWPGLYAGREHFIYDSDQDSAALAWFKDFEKRADGIWASEDGLTPAGAAAIKNRDYKFTSFVADPSDLQKVEGNRYRVMKIETVGFTNYANGKELLTPVANRQDFAGGGPSAAHQQQQTKRNMKSIATELGLAAEASEDAILAELTKLRNRIHELEPLSVENTKLKNRLDQTESEQVDALLVERKIIEPKIINRLKPGLLKLANREERLAFLTDLGFTGEAKQEKSQSQGRVLNRGQGGGAAADATTEDESAKVEKIRNRAAELKKGGLSFDAAWAAAVAEHAK